MSKGQNCLPQTPPYSDAIHTHSPLSKDPSQHYLGHYKQFAFTKSYKHRPIWRLGKKLDSEQVHKLCSSPDIIKIMTDSNIGGAYHTAVVREIRK